jgi:tRNA:m4X modification enzyme
MSAEIEDSHVLKKQKVDDITINPKPIINKCAFIKPKNGKKCGLQVRKGQIYCFAHINYGKPNDAKTSEVSIEESEITRINKKGDIIKRVKCPIDPSHTIWEDNMKKHLKICNVIKHKDEIAHKELTCKWFNIDYNVKDVKHFEMNNEIDYDYWKELIFKWVNKYDEIFEDNEIPLQKIAFKEGLEERFAEVSNQKHILQQSSLIGQLMKNGLINKNEDPGIVIEFGCGRAEFSRYFNKAMNEVYKDNNEHSGKYLLIDRENPRLKFDNKIINDSEEKGFKNIKVERLKVDIKDLKLIEALKLFQNTGNGDNTFNKYLGISKHLCGVATDLTLRCLINLSKDLIDNKFLLKFNGCLVAMCCRHCCKHEWLLEDSKKYLQENFDINASNFIYLRKMFAWATNGVKPGMLQTDIGDHFTGLSYEEREKIGLKMRRILDESRKFAMENEGFDVKIVKYVEREVSLENNCIIIKNREENK